MKTMTAMITKMISKVKEWDLVTKLLAGAFLIEILLFTYYNLFHIDQVDPDFAMILRHTIEIARNHAFFIKGWVYDTTAEFDCSVLTAVPLYLITGNVYISYAISNILVMIAWIFLVYFLQKRMDLDIKYRLLGLLFIFAAYSIGGIRYSDMMFYNGGYYAYKVFVILLLIMILSDMDADVKSASNIAKLVLYSFLLFLTCVSSGVYVMLCGLFPVAVCVAGYVFTGHFKEKRLYLIILGAISLGATAAGLLLNTLLKVESTTYELHGVHQILEHIWATLADYFDLFVPIGSFGTEVAIKPFSATGIFQLICITLAIVITCLGLKSLGRVFNPGIVKNDEAARAGEDSESGDFRGTGSTCKERYIECMLISVAAWNFFIVLLTAESTSRYHIISMIPIMLCAVLNLKRIFNKEGGRFFFLDKNLTLGLFAVVFTAYALFSFHWTKEVHFHELDSRSEVMNEIIRYMDENDIDTVFSSDFGTMETLRLVDADKDRTFVLYDPIQGGIVNNKDFYGDRCDRGAFSDRNMIVMTVEKANESASYFTEQIVSNYEQTQEVLGYRFFVSDTCPIDGRAGFPMTEHSTDLPITEGYETAGEIDKDARLISYGAGAILTSPPLASDGKKEYKLVLHYQANEIADGEIHISRDGEDIYVLPLDNAADEAEAVIPAVAGDYVISVVMNNSAPMIIERLDFYDNSPL